MCMKSTSMAILLILLVQSNTGQPYPRGEETFHSIPFINPLLIIVILTVLILGIGLFVYLKMRKRKKQ